MQESDPKNAAFEWSTHFVRSLYEIGIEHAFISPGSRSTALTLAFSAHPGIVSHIVIDERSAAFQALGVGKASGTPAVLVCTSGTAVANYLPAVIEATQSATPLIVLSADRPPQYRNVGASQTIDQLKIFGDYPVFFHEAGEPNDSEKAIRRLKMVAHQAVDESVGKGGVAHINFPFSKPFEPTAEVLEQTEKENSKNLKMVSQSYSQEAGKTVLGETFWSDLVSAERPLIIVGPVSHSDQTNFITPLARTLNAPILAEPGSQVPSSRYTIEGFEGFLKNPDNYEDLGADLILRFGSQPVSKALNQYLEAHESVMQISFMNSNLWADGTLTSHKIIHLDSPLEIPDIKGAAENKWLKRWKNTQKTFKKLCSETLKSSSLLTDGAIFSSISKVLPKKGFCMLSNSFPVRDLSLFGEFDGKEIYVNRGAAGIDGITSTMLGLSLALNTPGTLFIGDIAFLHDSNALLAAKEIDKPLVVVILNNGGGTIFRMLPVHKIKKTYTRFFETPQSVKIAALCRAHNIDHTLVSKPEQVVETYEKLIQQNGVHVMECMTGADASMEQRHTLWNFKLNQDS